MYVGLEKVILIFEIWMMVLEYWIFLYNGIILLGREVFENIDIDLFVDIYCFGVFLVFYYEIFIIIREM